MKCQLHETCSEMTPTHWNVCLRWNKCHLRQTISSRALQGGLPRPFTTTRTYAEPQKLGAQGEMPRDLGRNFQLIFEQPHTREGASSEPSFIRERFVRLPWFIPCRRDESSFQSDILIHTNICDTGLASPYHSVQKLIPMSNLLGG